MLGLLSVRNGDADAAADVMAMNSIEKRGGGNWNISDFMLFRRFGTVPNNAGLKHP